MSLLLLGVGGALNATPPTPDTGAYWADSYFHTSYFPNSYWF